MKMTEDTRRARELAAEGVDPKEIGKQMHRPMSWVRAALKFKEPPADVNAALADVCAGVPNPTIAERHGERALNAAIKLHGQGERA